MNNHLITDRLLIMPCSLDLAKSVVLFRDELGERSPIEFPENWPTDEVKSLLPLYIESLEKDNTEYGWGLWLIIDYEEQRVIGDLNFKGKPNDDGIIEMGYSILPKYRQQGYAYEATQALLNWGFAHPSVQVIRAECFQNNQASQRVLEKLGMRCVEKDKEYLTWELKRAEP